MAIATIVAVLMATGETSPPMTEALTAAVEEALGPGTSVVLRISAGPSDGEALELERELHAEAIARIAWEGPSHSVAVLRTHLAKVDRWIERRVAFSPGDSRPERGRTLGFSVAALLLSDQDLDDAVRVRPRSIGEGGGVSAAAVAVTARSSPPALPSSTEQEYSRGRVAVDLAATGAVGIAGPAAGLGGMAHAEYMVASAVFIRVGALVRTGTVPGLNGGDTIGAAGGGIAFRPAVPSGTNHPFGLGLAVEALAIYHDLYHRDVSGLTLHRGRMLPAFSALVEGSWAMGRSVDACVGLGVEAASGSTDVVVAGQSVAAIPPVRIIGQLGLRVHF